MAGIGKFLNFKIVSLETCSSYKIIWETCDYLRNLWSLKSDKLNLPLSYSKIKEEINSQVNKVLAIWYPLRKKNIGYFTILGAIFILRKGVFGLFQTTHLPL